MDNNKAQAFEPRGCVRATDSRLRQINGEEGAYMSKKTLFVVIALWGVALIGALMMHHISSV